MYGFSFEVPTGEGLEFGLNQNCKLIDIKYNPNGGKEGAKQDALDLIFDVNGRQESNRQFPATAWENNIKITDENHPKVQKAMNELGMYVGQLLKCYQDEDVIQSMMEDAFSGKKVTFALWAKTAEQIVKSNDEWKEVRLDLFAQYPYTLKSHQHVKYPELPRPKYVRQGLWVVPHEDGGFEVDKNADGLVYTKQNEDGQTVEHPITRSKSWLNSKFANDEKMEVTISTDNQPLSVGDLPFSS